MRKDTMDLGGVTSLIIREISQYNPFLKGIKRNIKVLTIMIQ